VDVGTSAEPERADNGRGEEPDVGPHAMGGTDPAAARRDSIDTQGVPADAALDRDCVEEGGADHSPPAQLVPWRLVLVGAAALTGATMVALLLSVLLSEGLPGSGQNSFEAAAARETRMSAAYVTASILECRSAPAREAASMRRLARGTRLEVLSLDGDWVSVSHGGRQCWVAARYLSIQEPL